MKSASFLLHPSSQDIKDLCGKTPMIHYLLHHVQSQMQHASLCANISAALIQAKHSLQAQQRAAAAAQVAVKQLRNLQPRRQWLLSLQQLSRSQRQSHLRQPLPLAARSPLACAQQERTGGVACIAVLSAASSHMMVTTRATAALALVSLIRAC